MEFADSFDKRGLVGFFSLLLEGRFEVAFDQELRLNSGRVVVHNELGSFDGGTQKFFLPGVVESLAGLLLVQSQVLELLALLRGEPVQKYALGGLQVLWVLGLARRPVFLRVAPQRTQEILLAAESGGVTASAFVQNVGVSPAAVAFVLGHGNFFSLVISSYFGVGLYVRLEDFIIRLCGETWTWFLFIRPPFPARIYESLPIPSAWYFVYFGLRGKLIIYYFIF